MRKRAVFLVFVSDVISEIISHLSRGSTRRTNCDAHDRACAGSVPCLLSLCGLNLSFSLYFLLHISWAKTLTHRLYMYLRS